MLILVFYWCLEALILGFGVADMWFFGFHFFAETNVGDASGAQRDDGAGEAKAWRAERPPDGDY